MHPLLTRTFELSEARRKKLIHQVKALSGTDKFYRHKDGKWSISQILAHLIQAEELSLNYMKKKSLGIDTAGDTGLVEEVKFLVLKISQRLPLRYKAPAVLGEDGPPSMPFDNIVERWDALRDSLKIFLESIKDEQLKRKIYKHAVMGRLNVVQAVRFFDEHLIHHQPQINRLLQ
jgi:hypothetical protein